MIHGDILYILPLFCYISNIYTRRQGRQKINYLQSWGAKITKKLPISVVYCVINNNIIYVYCDSTYIKMFIEML